MPRFSSPSRILLYFFFPRFSDLEAAFQLLKSQAQETSQAVDGLRECGRGGKHHDGGSREVRK
jgi:hypothetical protein